jgi:MSHA biogenesis protein MshI
MISWLKGKKIAGWTSVVVETDGLYGVTVLVPDQFGGKPRVVKCAAMPGRQLNAETLAELSKKISVNGCPWTLSLGHKEYNILVIPEPSVQRTEFDQSVRWLISNMIDYPVEEASVAWMQIPTVELLPNRPANLYVLLAKNELIAGYEALFRKARISLQAIDVRETAQRNIAALAAKPGEGVGMLLIGKQGVQFTITFNGELYLDRFIQENLFASEFQDDDARMQSCERIALQIQRSLDFIGRTLAFIDVNRILMAPMPGNLNLGDSISKYLQVPVETFDLAAAFDFSAAPELARQENQALYFSALGGALRFMDKCQQIRLQGQKNNEINFTRSALAVLSLLILSLLGLWGVRQGDVMTAQKLEAASALQLQQANDRLRARTQQHGEDLDAEIAALKPQADAAQNLMAQAGQLGSPQGYARYFSLLASIPEDGLWLTNVSVDKAGKSVSISGHALRKESVMRYADRLNTHFASFGVQFTALELLPESVGKQGSPNDQLTAVAFKLY